MEKIKVILPTISIVDRVKEARNDCMFVEAFFTKYKVEFENITMTFEPNPGFEYNPTDIFMLAWYVKEEPVKRLK